MRNRPIPSAPITSSAATSSRSPALTIKRHPVPVLGDRRHVAQRGIGRAPFLPDGEAPLERFLHRRRRPDEHRTLGHVQQQQVALRNLAADVADPAQHGHPHRPGDDRHVRGQRSFLQDHPLQPALVIFQQLGGPQIARDQDRVLRKPELRGGAHLAGHDPQQPVRQILQIMHPVGEQRIVDLAHPLAGALLDALDRGLGGQAAVDRLVDPACASPSS